MVPGIMVLVGLSAVLGAITRDAAKTN